MYWLMRAKRYESLERTFLLCADIRRIASLPSVPIKVEVAP